MIKDLKDGGSYQLLVICTNKTLGKTKNNKDYFSLELRDKSGTVAAKVWDTNILPEFETGSVIKVHGTCNLWEDKPQLTITYCCVAEDGTYNIEDLCPAADYDVEQMFTSLMNYVNSIKEPLYRDVLLHFFECKEILNLMKKHYLLYTLTCRSRVRSWWYSGYNECLRKNRTFVYNWSCRYKRFLC